MGEYATRNGQQVKIGTCENMYYLRADQADEIDGYTFDEETLGVVRFRFPFPDEDTIEPGHFDDHDRGVRVPGYQLPAELSGDEHGSVQFASRAGYVLSIPCPEGLRLDGDAGSTDVDGLRVHRNGFNGHPVVSQQAYRGGRLVTLLRCGACGAMHRLDTAADAAPVADAFIDEAERKEWRGMPSELEYANSEDTRRFYAIIARRILAGYETTVPVA